MDEQKQLLEEVRGKIPNEENWSIGTGILLALLAGIWALAFIGLIPTDYNIFFFILSIITGFYWIKEKNKWHQYLKINHEKELVRPWWLAWTAGVFPIIIFIFLLRGFLVEPFKVPTGSMIPNIMIGEVTITNKMYYDLKIPILEKTIVKFREVKRGDVVVFRYPLNPMTYYIKRFVGLPKDVIEYNYISKKLTINGAALKTEEVSHFNAAGKNIVEYNEDLLGVNHSIWIEPNQFAGPDPVKTKFSHIDACQYSIDKLKCTVPEGYYFAMGDNRDNSEDSRYWGFVPEKNIVGKAQLIAYSPVDIARIGWIK